MDIKEAVDVLDELLEDARTVHEDRYGDAFITAIQAMGDVNMLKRIARVQEEMLKDMWGEEKYHKFASDVAKEAFRRDINEMADSDFKDFVLEHFDRITDNAVETEKENDS